MANYVLVYTGSTQPATQAEMPAVMAAWTAWFDGLGPSIVDSGRPFGASLALADGGTVSEGGPSGLTGYTIVSADNLSAAAALAKTCPHLAHGGRIEVYETIKM